jgi:hypothetical protein
MPPMFPDMTMLGSDMSLMPSDMSISISLD